MARPKKQIDEDQLYKLAAINCSNEEMASILGCSKDTLERRFAAVIEKGRSNGKSSLKRKQYEIAMKGNVTMLIWLGKIMLGQKEQRDLDVRMEIPQPVYATVNDADKTSE